MDLAALVPGLVGAFVGSIGWLFVGLYINYRVGKAGARHAARAVYFEIELNRANIDVARSYGEMLPLSRAAYEQLLPQLANLLNVRDLSSVAAAYMSHIGYEQLRQSREHPQAARQEALSGILAAQETATARLKAIAFTRAEQGQLI
jgi:hypothetical protein